MNESKPIRQTQTAAEAAYRMAGEFVIKGDMLAAKVAIRRFHHLRKEAAGKTGAGKTLPVEVRRQE